MKGRTDVRTENDVMTILPNFLPSMGYQYFLSYGARRARSSAKKTPLAGEYIVMRRDGKAKQLYTKQRKDN